MPLGSSSAAPVTSPGPRKRSQGAAEARTLAFAMRLPDPAPDFRRGRLVIADMRRLFRPYQFVSSRATTVGSRCAQSAEPDFRTLTNLGFQNVPHLPQGVFGFLRRVRSNTIGRHEQLVVPHVCIVSGEQNANVGR